MILSMPTRRAAPLQSSLFRASRPAIIGRQTNRLPSRLPQASTLRRAVSPHAATTSSAEENNVRNEGKPGCLSDLCMAVDLSRNGDENSLAASKAAAAVSSPDVSGSFAVNTDHYEDQTGPYTKDTSSGATMTQNLLESLNRSIPCRQDAVSFGGAVTCEAHDFCTDLSMPDSLGGVLVDGPRRIETVDCVCTPLPPPHLDSSVSKLWLMASDRENLCAGIESETANAALLQSRANQDILDTETSELCQHVQENFENSSICEELNFGHESAGNSLNFLFIPPAVANEKDMGLKDMEYAAGFGDPAQAHSFGSNLECDRGNDDMSWSSKRWDVAEAASVLHAHDYDLYPLPPLISSDLHANKTGIAGNGEATSITFKEHNSVPSLLSLPSQAELPLPSFEPAKAAAALEISCSLEYALISQPFFMTMQDTAPEKATPVSEWQA